MRTEVTTVTFPLYVLIVPSGPGDLGEWTWYVTTQRVPDERKPNILDCVNWGFGLTRWTCRWGARRACRRSAHGKRLTERWIYDPLAPTNGDES